eukprot:TRINITY_DN8489_c0_g1_i1.p2 TRINITY_DN8489_c0_g1~~TRINITY_DN8489_c0_g1_i1.p2  ORF type:complete len:243 (+),score=42.21 TRINITY_DN8489_c0_g1_i1:132-860(+)
MTHRRPPLRRGATCLALFDASIGALRVLLAEGPAHRPPRHGMEPTLAGVDWLHVKTVGGALRPVEHDKDCSRPLPKLVPKPAPSVPTVAEADVHEESVFNFGRCAVVRVLCQKVFPKTLRPVGSTSGSARQVCILAKLKLSPLPLHPTFVPLMYFVQPADGVASGFLLECVPGGVLAERKTANVEGTSRWKRQMRGGVMDLRKRGVTWGNVEPGNVLIDQHNNGRIIDFGAAERETKHSRRQ